MFRTSKLLGALLVGLVAYPTAAGAQALRPETIRLQTNGR